MYVLQTCPPWLSEGSRASLCTAYIVKHNKQFINYPTNKSTYIAKIEANFLSPGLTTGLEIQHYWAGRRFDLIELYYCVNLNVSSIFIIIAVLFLHCSSTRHDHPHGRVLTKCGTTRIQSLCRPLVRGGRYNGWCGITLLGWVIPGRTFRYKGSGDVHTVDLDQSP